MSSTLDMDTWSRGCLTLAWGSVAWIALRGPRSRGSLFCAGVAICLALAAALRWHVALLHGARALLQEVGLYPDREVVKFALAAVIVGVLAVAVRWAWLHPSGLRGALIAVAGFAGYLAAFTVLLDGYLPEAAGRAPGRQLIEAGFAVSAILCLRAWRRGDARAR